jgi:tRNA(adenine34) deaminase
MTFKSIPKLIRNAILLLFGLAAFPFFSLPSEDIEEAAELNKLEKAVASTIPDPRYPHDRFILVTLREAIRAKRESSGGGVGACLVRESTGEIVALGHNRQFSPYFRSDMHAEMDLLDRYEDQMKTARVPGEKSFNPRKVEGLTLFSSVEPCPMCLARIINAGLKKTYYAASDPAGGMVHKFNDLPPFWKDAADGRIYAEADCSPTLKDLATRLFNHGKRNIKTVN